MNNTSAYNRKIVAIDRKRETLLKGNNTNAFIDTYKDALEVPNNNTGRYWDNIFEDESGLANQSPMTKDKIKTIVNQIPKTKVKITDLGIGQGFLEEALLKRNINYTIHGLDISPRSIKRACFLFKGKFEIGNVLEMDKFYKKESADIIVALELLEHIPTNNLFDFYNKIHITLKEKGVFIASVPINENLQLSDQNPSAHLRDYTINIISKELEISGFKVEKTFYLYAFNKFYSLKRMLAKILKNRWKPNSLIIVARKV